jgi:hypothetical protein
MKIDQIRITKVKGMAKIDSHLPKKIIVEEIKLRAMSKKLIGVLLLQKNLFKEEYLIAKPSV